MKGMGLILAGAVVLSGCTPDFIDSGEAPVLMVVNTIAGTSGGGGAGSGIASVLLSDVRSDTGSVFNDNATITVAVHPKNPRVANASPFNDVVLEQYRVRYRRTDGHDREGVEVPFAFTGPMALRVPVGGTGAASIVIVRHAAKLEPPLRNLQRQGGLDLLTTFAEITVFGRTVAGDAVEASGRLEVHFADFGG